MFGPGFFGKGFMGAGFFGPSAGSTATPSLPVSGYKGRGRFKGPFISDPFKLKRTRFPS